MHFGEETGLGVLEGTTLSTWKLSPSPALGVAWEGGGCSPGLPQEVTPSPHTHTEKMLRPVATLPSGQ